MEELAYGLAQTSAVASGLGMSLKDTNIALGIFANNGLRGSDAGTSFKTFLSNLIPVTDKQIELFDKLGLTTAGVGNQFFTAEGNIKSFEEIADVMQKTFANMTAMERQFALEQIFGSDALRAGTIIALEGAAGVKKFNDEMSRVTALEVARKKMNNAAGAAEEFQGALNTPISAMLPFCRRSNEWLRGLLRLPKNIPRPSSPQWKARLKRLRSSLIGFRKMKNSRTLAGAKR